jgi:hypothetical protein
MTTVDYTRLYWQSHSEPVVGPPSRGGGTWVLHHPGGGTTAPGESACIKYLRSMQTSYLKSRGYSVGYNYTVNQDGTSWGVREKDLNNAANAGRKVSGNFNARSKSIQLMATDEFASPKAIAEINRIIATEPTWNVVAHCDVDYTACCGAPFISQIREGVIGQQGSTKPPRPPKPTTRYAQNPIEIEGYDAPNNWWLFPLNPNKPTLKLGSDWDAHVQYARHVIYYYAGGNIALTGPFDAHMKSRVIELQKYLGFPSNYVDGIIGNDKNYPTWSIFDYIVQINMPAPPAPIVKLAPTYNDPSVGVKQVDDCSYYINKDDRPWSVAKLVYGYGTQNTKLDHDRFKMYSTPGHAAFVVTPDVPGKQASIQPNEGQLAVLRRMGYEDPNPVLDKFYEWNGGWERVMQEGDVVYMPD